jgi:hypothetical protein
MVVTDNYMDDALKTKLDEARNRMNGEQAGINMNRKHADPAMREWARGKQRPANAERSLFRNSLTEGDRKQIEERIQQLPITTRHYPQRTVRHWTQKSSRLLLPRPRLVDLPPRRPYYPCQWPLRPNQWGKRFPITASSERSGVGAWVWCTRQKTSNLVATSL